MDTVKLPTSGLAVELARAVAVLCLEYRLVDPQVALELASRMEGEPDKVARQLLDTFAEKPLLKAIASELGLQYHDLHSTGGTFSVDEDLLSRCDLATLRERLALPMVGKDKRIVVAVADPSDWALTEYLKQVFPEGFDVALVSAHQIRSKLITYSDDGAEVIAEQQRREQQLASTVQVSSASAAESSPIVQFLDLLLERAAAEQASDIHLLFDSETSAQVRFRIDGVLRVQPYALTAVSGRQIVGAVMSRTMTMDVADTRTPQDGTFAFRFGARAIDVRVSTLPQVWGTRLVMRLLDSNNISIPLDQMGFAPRTLQLMREATTQSMGMLVASGPTGSGKSTTLYSILREIDPITRNILTVEDPVEYKLANIGQTAIRAGLGELSLTFARALRAILRQDPDVILVGEMRDPETVKTAMDAAITGHLVLSTLHARSAVGVYTRLIEMGAPGYLVADAVSLSVAQRLVRRVHECRQLEAPTLAEVRQYTKAGLEVPDVLAHPVGCEGCSGTGYRGRLAVSEALSSDGELRELLVTGQLGDRLYQAARETGYTTLFEDGLRMAADGATTVAEIRRVVELDTDG
jgi:type IV pilus assembly protein PilB